MIQRRFADQLGKRLGLRRRDSEVLLRNITRGWAEALQAEGKLSLPALGRLEVKERASRTISDVRTKQRRILFGKKAVAFRPLPRLTAALNPDRPPVGRLEPGGVAIPVHLKPAQPPPTPVARTEPRSAPAAQAEPASPQPAELAPSLPIRPVLPPERTARNLLRALRARQGNRLELIRGRPASAVLWYDGQRLIGQAALSPEVAGGVASELEALAGLPDSQADLDQPATGSFRLNLGDGQQSVSLTRLNAIGRTLYLVSLFDPQYVSGSLLPFALRPNEAEQFQKDLAQSGALLISAPPREGLTSLYLSALLAGLLIHHPVASLEYEHRLRVPEILQLPWPEHQGARQRLLRSLIHYQPSLLGIEAPSLAGLEGFEAMAERGSTLVLAVPGTSLLSTVRRLHSLSPGLATHLHSALQLRLLPRLCPECLRTRRPSADEARRLTAHFGERAPRVVADARGCPRCEQGLSGRLPILELWPLTEPLHRAIRTGDHQAIRSHKSHRTFKDKLLEHLTNGEVGLGALA